VADPNGVPDTVNLVSASRTRIRVSTNAANNVFVGVDPTNGFAEPNPYLAGRTAFQGAIANTGTTNASGAGFQIARIFIPTGGTGVLSGNIGGDIGSKVGFSVQLGGPTGGVAPVINSITPNPVNVVFGQIVSNGAPFSTTVNATDADGDLAGLAVSANPNVTGVTITPGAGGNFTVSGTVNYAANNTDIVLGVTATDAAGHTSASSNLTLHVTPEPASLSLIGLSTLLRSSHRPGPIVLTAHYAH